MAEIIAERILTQRDGQPITVRIERPVQRAAGEWGCRAEVGDRTIEVYGADSAQALFHALDAAGAEIRWLKSESL